LLPKVTQSFPRALPFSRWLLLPFFFFFTCDMRCCGLLLCSCPARSAARLPLASRFVFLCCHPHGRTRLARARCCSTRAPCPCSFQ
jgi:hypothetical protein